MRYLKSQISNFLSTTFANCLAASFYLLFHSLYNIRLRGLENYRATPSLLITINHKRDLDIPIVGSILHLHRTVLKNKMRPYFVARDDLFYPGFLTAHFKLLGGAGSLIHRLSLAPVMSALRAYPISRLLRKRIGSIMHEIKRLNGDMLLKQAINQSGIEKFNQLLSNYKGNLGNITVSDFLSHKFRSLHQQTADISILKDGLSRKIRVKTLKHINRQLRVFAGILDKGGICLMAPEGQLSPDGRLGQLKSGLHRLISMTSTDVRIIPVNTTYDFMTRRRMRIYVTIGTEINHPRNYKKTELEQRVQRSIVNLGPVTMGQLGSDFLVSTAETGRDSFSESELLAASSAKIEKLHAGGVRLEDRILTASSLKKRARDFLGYCLDKGIVSRDNGSYRIDKSSLAAGMSDKWRQNPVMYSANELRSRQEIIKF